MRDQSGERVSQAVNQMRSHASHRAGPIRERQLLVGLLERKRALGQRTVNAVDPRKGERQKQRNHTAAGTQK